MGSLGAFKNLLVLILLFVSTGTNVNESQWNKRPSQQWIYGRSSNGVEPSQSRRNISYRRNPMRSYRSSFKDASQGDLEMARDSQTSHTLDKTPFVQSPSPKATDNRPNILLIMTDDLDIELGSLNYMPNLLRLLGGEGAIFSNSYTSTPMCCPSRSSMLTGMYIHNHEVYTNNQNCSSFHWRTTHERRSFASYLHNAGYRTGYYGKYLNRYNGSHVPDGWQEWGGLIGNSRYYNYTVNRNGRHVKYFNRYPQDYYPHVITSDGIQFLRNRKTNPFMLVLSYPSPHGPEDSAPEHSHRFFNSSDHHTASYNYAPNPDKQWLLQFTDRMSDLQLKYTDLLMTKRLQTLQTVDESIDKVVRELTALGQLDNTYIFFTSDHGYHLGQFGLAKGKSMPFEFDIKVPFLVRGPKVKKGSRVPHIALNIDLAPTFLDIAGVKAPSHMDGRSLKLVLENTSDSQKKVKWRDSFLIESSGRIRDEEELQKQAQRSWQRSKALSMETAVNDHSVHDILYTSKHERFQEVCARYEFQSPCSSTQKWFCVQNGNRWRLKKCRPKQSLWRKRCICQSPFGLGSYRRLDAHERRRQKKFLKRYLNIELNQINPKFIQAFNNVHIISGWENRKKYRKPKSKRKASRRRPKRDVANNSTDAVEDIDGEVHDFVETEELRDIQHQILDISDELHALEGANGMNTSESSTKENIKESDITITDQCDLNRNCTHTNNSDFIYETSKESLHQHIQRLKQQLSVIKNIYSHLQSQRPNLDVLNLEEEKDYLYESGGKNRTITTDPPFSFDNEALIVSPEAHYDDQLSVLPIPSNKEITSMGSPSENTNLFPKNYLDTTISMSNGHQLYPIPLSLLLDELTISENEETEPLCWCDKRVLRRLELQKARSDRREERKLLKKNRLKLKYERKQKKRNKLQWCDHPKLHCYAHDNSHWRTPPLWTDGYFCFCMSASNNTYWCLRTINDEHNFLYCEFITGLITYFDHHIDPYQLRNVAFTLSSDRVVELHNKLTRLRICSGNPSCHNADQFNHEVNRSTELKPREKLTNRRTLKDKIKAASGNTVYRSEFFSRKQKKRKIKQMKRLKEKLRRKTRKDKEEKQNKYAALLGLPEKSLNPSLIANDAKERIPRKSRHRKNKKKKRRQKKRNRKLRKIKTVA